MSKIEGKKLEVSSIFSFSMRIDFCKPALGLNICGSRIFVLLTVYCPSPVMIKEGFHGLVFRDISKAGKVRLHPPILQ